MSSLPNPPTATQPDRDPWDTRAGHLLKLFTTMPDPRHSRVPSCPLAGIFALALTAVMAGSRSW